MENSQFIEKLKNLLHDYDVSFKVQVTDIDNCLTSIQIVIGGENGQTYTFRSEFEPTLNGYDLENISTERINR